MSASRSNHHDREATPAEFASDVEQARPPVIRKKPSESTEPRKFVWDELSKTERKLYVNRVLNIQSEDYKLQPRRPEDPSYTIDEPCHQCSRDRSSAIAHVAHEQVDRACAAQIRPTKLVAATESKMDVPSLFLIASDLIFFRAVTTRPDYAQIDEAYTTGDPRAQQFGRTAYLSIPACDSRLSTAKLDARAELEAQWAATEQSKGMGPADQPYTTTRTAGLKRPIDQMSGPGLSKQMREKIFTHVRAYTARKARRSAKTPPRSRSRILVIRGSC
jgi:hypothetical protein